MVGRIILNTRLLFLNNRIMPCPFHPSDIILKPTLENQSSMCNIEYNIFPSIRGESMKRSFRFSLKILGILSLTFLLASCIIGRYYEGPKISEEKLKEIKPGITTKAEIISWFGPPQNFISPTVFNEILREMDVTREPLTNYPFANILSYQYNRGNIQAIVLVLFNFVDANVKSDHLVIFLDDNEKVKYYGFRKGTDELQ
jgi:hypothetical protein